MLHPRTRSPPLHLKVGRNVTQDRTSTSGNRHQGREGEACSKCLEEHEHRVAMPNAEQKCTCSSRHVWHMRPPGLPYAVIVPTHLLPLRLPHSTGWRECTEPRPEYRIKAEQPPKQCMQRHWAGKAAASRSTMHKTEHITSRCTGQAQPPPQSTWRQQTIPTAWDSLNSSTPPYNGMAAQYLNGRPIGH